MKLAIFSDTFLPQTNGVATVAHKSAQALSELGHEVVIFTALKKTGNDLEKENGNGKFQITTLPSLGFPFYPGERAALPTGLAVKKVKSFRPQIIHSHTPFGLGWEGVIAAKLFGIPLVGTHHTFYDHYLRHIKMDYEWMKKISWQYVVAYYNRANLVLSPTQSLAETLRAHGLKKPVEILPNSVDDEYFSSAANQAAKNKLKAKFGIKGVSLVYMGRLSYEKNIDRLLRVFRLLADQFPQLQLMFIGQGPERERLEKMARHLQVAKNIIFTGALRNQELLDGLRANDIFVTASKSENMPMAVLEAMAAGLPVVAPGALGLAEMVKDSENGFLTPPDDPEAMAEKIAELVRNPRLVKKFSRESRKRVADYSQRKITKSLVDIYEKLL